MKVVPSELGLGWAGSSCAGEEIVVQVWRIEKSWEVSMWHAGFPTPAHCTAKVRRAGCAIDALYSSVSTLRNLKFLYSHDPLEVVEIRTPLTMTERRKSYQSLRRLP